MKEKELLPAKQAAWTSAQEPGDKYSAGMIGNAYIASMCSRAEHSEVVMSLQLG